MGIWHISVIFRDLATFNQFPVILAKTGYSGPGERWTDKQLNLLSGRSLAKVHENYRGVLGIWAHFAVQTFKGGYGPDPGLWPFSPLLTAGGVLCEKLSPTVHIFTHFGQFCQFWPFPVRLDWCFLCPGLFVQGLNGGSCHFACFEPKGPLLTAGGVLSAKYVRHLCKFPRVCA